MLKINIGWKQRKFSYLIIIIMYGNWKITHLSNIGHKCVTHSSLEHSLNGDIIKFYASFVRTK